MIKNIMMIYKKTILLFFLCLMMNGYSQNEQHDFDWNSYASWKNETKYTRSYVVNQKHSNASDSSACR